MDHVYVGQIELYDGTGYTTVNTSEVGAYDALYSWASGLGISSFEEDDRVTTYGVSYLPVGD